MTTGITFTDKGEALEYRSKMMGEGYRTVIAQVPGGYRVILDYKVGQLPKHLPWEERQRQAPPWTDLDASDRELAEKDWNRQEEEWRRQDEEDKVRVRNMITKLKALAPEWEVFGDLHFGPSLRAHDASGKPIKFQSKSEAQAFANRVRALGIKNVRISKDTHGKQFWYVVVSRYINYEQRMTPGV